MEFERHPGIAHLLKSYLQVRARERSSSNKRMLTMVSCKNVSKQLGLHETECEFYSKFVSMIPVRIPTCYEILPKSKAIVMEDLRQYHRAPEFTLTNGLKVVQAIAKLHSYFRGMQLGKLTGHTEHMINYQHFRERWSSTLTEGVIKKFDHAAEFYEDAAAQMLSKPCTLLHGDLKFSNLFWDYSGKDGEPIFIVWQYTGLGQGIEDVVFLLVESCASSNFKFLADALINAYYDEREKHDDVHVPHSERNVQVSCALAGFPLFVAVWFGSINAWH